QPVTDREASQGGTEIRKEGYGWQPCQPHPGTRYNRCGCSLPGLTGFTANRCEGTDRVTIACPADEGRAIVTTCAQVTSDNGRQDATPEPLAVPDPPLARGIITLI